MNSLMPLNSSYHKLKSLVKKNLDAYKLIMEENLLV